MLRRTERLTRERKSVLLAMPQGLVSTQEKTLVRLEMQEILKVLMSGSTNTGVAPMYVTAKAVAIYVLDGTITSSPAPMFNALNDGRAGKKNCMYV